MTEIDTTEILARRISRYITDPTAKDDILTLCAALDATRVERDEALRLSTFTRRVASRCLRIAQGDRERLRAAEARIAAALAILPDWPNPSAIRRALIGETQ